MRILRQDFALIGVQDHVLSDRENSRRAEDLSQSCEAKRSAVCGVALDLNSSRSTAGSTCTEHDCRDLRLCVSCMIALVHSQPACELRGSMGGSARRRPFLAHKSIYTNIVASVLPLLASLI